LFKLSLIIVFTLWAFTNVGFTQDTAKNPALTKEEVAANKKEKDKKEAEEKKKSQKLLLAYPKQQFNLLLNQNMKPIRPRFKVKDKSVLKKLFFDVSPELPDGITIDPKKGYISGRPRSFSGMTTYTITITNKVTGKDLKAKIRLATAAEDRDMLMWAAVFLVGIGVYIITLTRFQDEDEYKAQEKLEDGDKKKSDNPDEHGIVLKYSRPFFRRYLTPVVAGMKNKKKIHAKYKKKLATAGLQNFLTPEDIFSFKLFLIIGFPILFLGVRYFLEEEWPLKLIFIISIIGYFYPDFWIKGLGEKRQKKIVLGMPFIIDMLALSVEAGLDFVAAMQKVVEKAKPGPLSDEFLLVLKEIKIGASRAEALRNMAWRIDLIQISSFSATLIAADSVGASIGPILKALSKEIREKRSSEAEKAGATAATKILFPMLFLIVPAVFIVVGAPIILESIGASK
jgi:tight adherence protein C